MDLLPTLSHRRKWPCTPILGAAALLAVTWGPVASSVSASRPTGVAATPLPTDVDLSASADAEMLRTGRGPAAAEQLPNNGTPSVFTRSESETVPELKVRTVVSGLTIPWDIAFAPDGTMLYTQRSGVLTAKLADGTTTTITADMSDLFARGETGLMAIAVDPAFESNRRIYTCQGHTGPEIQVIAWTLSDDYTMATRANDPLVGGIPADPTYGRHGGCRLRFGPANNLWIATGDATVGTHPQDQSTLGGKVLRVSAATGSAATGNPTAGSLVYSFGHRNVQGLALRPGTSEMWSVEHGPTFDDEINLLVAGGNCGWDPIPDYNERVSMTDLAKFPSAVEAKWSSGNSTLATSGGVFLAGDIWGAWEGRLAVATLKDRRLRLFEFGDDGAFVSQTSPSALRNTYGRLRTPVLGPGGALYITTSNGSGNDKILRVTPKQAPSFDEASYAVSVAEDTAIGSVVASVSAQDLNDDPFTYSLSGTGAALFRISDSATGDIELAAALDYETDTSHEIIVIASDVDQMAATVTATVTVSDMNEPSEITGDASINFVENGTGSVADYSANDPEQQEQVTWSLSGDDSGFFEIDSNGVLRFERSLDPPDREARRGYVYDVRVEASDGKDADEDTDPSIDDGLDVTVTVTDEDEAPTITAGPTTASVVEGHTGEVARFEAEDPESEGIAWELLGVDRADLTIGRMDGIVSFAGTPDFEHPDDSGADNSHVVTVQASDGRLTASQSLSVTVTNEDEPGMFKQELPQPQVGTVLEVTLSDPDGGVRDTTWNWKRSQVDSRSGWTTISAATSGSYTPVDGDVNRYLRVTASYRDREGPTDPQDPKKTIGAESDHAVRAAPASNRAPEFPTSETGLRSVEEDFVIGTDIGAAVAADDPDGDDLTYSLAGADAASFDIDADTGQLLTKAALDYENKAAYQISVTVRDPSRLSASQPVTIQVEDVNEAPTVFGPAVPGYAESRTDAVAQYTAADPEDDNVKWSLGGVDAGRFQIDEDTGELSFGHLFQPDHDTPADQDSDNVYGIVVKADDGKLTARYPVTVRVTPVNEPPTVTRTGGGEAEIAWVENDSGTVGRFEADDPEGQSVTWSLMGTDSGDLRIDDDGSLSFVEAPDFEHPADADLRNDYQVIVCAFDGEQCGTFAVIVTVADENEEGSLELSHTLPGVNSRLDAFLSEPDAGVADDAWSWERSKDGTDWTLIDSATSSSYRPSADDLGYRLRPTVTYSDKFGPGQSASVETVSAVQASAVVGLPALRPTTGAGGGDAGGGGAGGGGAAESTAVLIVVNGWSPADIGVAAALSARTPESAVIYTAPERLSSHARELLADYLPAELIAVGGEEAISNAVLTSARRASEVDAVQRFTGATRTDTAAAVAQHILGQADPSGATVIVANGWSPADIGVAAALSARTPRSAVVYAQPEALPQATKHLLEQFRPGRVVIVGGTAAVHPAVESAIRAAVPGMIVERVSGPTRAGTAAGVARRFLGPPEAAATSELAVIVANGWSPPDIGVAAALSARIEGSVVLYTQARHLPPEAEAVLRAYRPARLVFVGGPAAITNETKEQARAVVPGASAPRYSGSTRTHTAAAVARRILGNL